MTDLIKAADALAEVVVNQNWEALDAALSAYRQAREIADGVNTDGLFSDIEDILYDCIVSIQGEVSGLEEAYDRVTARIKAALED